MYAVFSIVYSCFFLYFRCFLIYFIINISTETIIFIFFSWLLSSRRISGASADDQTRFILDMVNTGRFVSLAVTLLRFDLSKDDITGIPPFLIHEMFHCCESNGMEPGKTKCCHTPPPRYLPGSGTDAQEGHPSHQMPSYHSVLRSL